MLLAVLAAFGCTPRGEGGVASTDPLPLDGAFAMHADFLDEITVVDAAGSDVPVEVVYAEEYSPGGWAPGKRMAVRAAAGWEPAAEYVANVHVKDAMSSAWGWYDVPFTVSNEPAIPVEGTPGITVESADVADFSCGPSTNYNVTLTPASADASGWSALLVETSAGEQEIFRLPEGPASKQIYTAEEVDYCLRVTQIDATGARSTSEWTCAELEPCGCSSNASAVLFVGVLGLGLKRRKAKG